MSLRTLSVALEEELKVFDCLVVNLLFCLAWLISFLSAFSHYSDKMYSLKLREGLGG